MKTHPPDDHSGLTGKVKNTLKRMEEIDQHRNLHRAVPILLFLLSGGFAARSYFWLIDLATWVGLGKLDPVFPASVAFILFFVVWMLVFLAGMSLLEWMHFRNIRSSASNRLSKLKLTTDEIRLLNRAVGSRTWRHDRILKDVTARLEAATR